MSSWEYKVVTSGKGGFATPALMEKFLNELGRDEWEIIDFHTSPDNPLAFNGLVRRLTQRDWTLEDAAAAAAKVEADKLRVEFEAKFRAAVTPDSEGTGEPPASYLNEKSAPDDGFRKPVDTSRDADADDEVDGKEDGWDKITTAEEDELPTFFDALRPHLRRNQRGPGVSVGVDYLARKWNQPEDDIKQALLECGFTLPEDEDSKPAYLEFEGDLYWLNLNRRGELWINTREKPRPVFRVVKARAMVTEAMDSTAESDESETTAAPHRNKSASRPEAAPPATGEKLPAGPELLRILRPRMRRNRRGPGISGSASFLSRALRCPEADLVAAFGSLGLIKPAAPNDKPVFVAIGDELWWINVDSRGALWIYGRERRPGDLAPASPAAEDPGETPDAEAEAAAPDGATAPEAEDHFTDLRPLLKKTRTRAVAGSLARLAEELGKTTDDLLNTLTSAGLKVPSKPREKPVFVETADKIFWLSRNTKDELWLNAKVSKFSASPSGSGDAAGGLSKPRRRGGSRKVSKDQPPVVLATDDASAAPDTPSA